MLFLNIYGNFPRRKTRYSVLILKQLMEFVYAVCKYRKSKENLCNFMKSNLRFFLS